MSTLKGVFPDLRPMKRKNFIHENVKNLRRMEQCFHSNKGTVEEKKIGDKYHNTLPKVNSSFPMKKQEANNADQIINNKIDRQPKFCTKSSVPMLNKNNISTKKMLHLSNYHSSIKQKGKENKDLHKSTQKLHGKVSSDNNILYNSTKEIDSTTKMQITFKSQGIQTLDMKQMDNLYSEGMIIYPSKKYVSNNDAISRTEAIQQIDISSRDATNSPSHQGNIHVSGKNTQNKNDFKCPELLSSKEETDFVKLNKERTSIISKSAQPNSSSNNRPTTYRKGVVPKYIRERKECQEKERKSKQETLNSDCPDGHVPLPDHERKETLNLLKKNYQDYVNELNMMPIKTDTLRAQRRKSEIEKQLNKLEEGIKVFSRPKVYVKVNS